jgi:hypothetical protein
VQKFWAVASLPGQGYRRDAVTRWGDELQAGWLASCTALQVLCWLAHSYYGEHTRYIVDRNCSVYMPESLRTANSVQCTTLSWATS